MFGLREWEVVPGKEEQAARTLERLEAEYVRVTGRRPIVYEEDHPQGALGQIDPETGRIELYSGERFGLGARAEELLHFEQLMVQGLLGMKLTQIPPRIRRKIEEEVEVLLRSAGFQPKR